MTPIFASIPCFDVVLVGQMDLEICWSSSAAHMFPTQLTHPGAPIQRPSRRVRLKPEEEPRAVRKSYSLSKHGEGREMREGPHVESLAASGFDIVVTSLMSSIGLCDWLLSDQREELLGSGRLKILLTVELTRPQAQQRGIVLSDRDLELCSPHDGLGNPVVDVAVELEDNQVAFLLVAGRTRTRHSRRVVFTHAQAGGQGQRCPGGAAIEPRLPGGSTASGMSPFGVLVSIAFERLRMRMSSGDSVGWDEDMSKPDFLIFLSTPRNTLFAENKALHPEREQVKAWHEEIIAAQNDQITLKYGLQMQLDRTRDWIEDLKSCIAAVEQDKITLQQKTVLERESFSVRKDKLSKEVDQVDEKIKEQKQVVRRSRIESDGLNDRKQETHNHLGELMMDLAKLESNLRRLEASRCQNEKQLQVDSQKHQELRQQRETLKKELLELGEVFSNTVQGLKEEISTVEREEENEVRAEHFHVSQQLERSKLQLEERIASVVRHGKEIKEMDKQIRELLETDTITKRVFERNQEELCDNVDTEKKNIEHYEEEKRLTMRLMHETKTKQEEHVAKMTSDISDTRRRYRELRQEEAALHKRHPKSTNADLLMSHMTQCEVEFRHKETKCHEEIEQCLMEVATITISHEEKQRELEEKEDVSNDVAAKWNEEQSRHQRLKTLTSELRRKRSELELTVQSLKEEAGSLLQPKEEMKAELEAMRKSYMDVLGTQASEMRAVEISVYDNSVKLEQVSTENSRLHLAIQQMTEDVTRAREDKERYWQEVQQFERNTKTLFEILQDAWRVDLQTTRTVRPATVFCWSP
ncbi:hypothetical protein F7725_005315 [Dissostichus mawsoni]|uniref:Uncharacterized protein n=1 Tax=Dissostichus mawsoni TaxID=36200 RepID=A0A7J5YRE0_DISMA|nr:hypothetical protein F7725_005315 [Dissostichus mawsoni]